MELPVCHKGTLRVSICCAVAVFLAVPAGFAQTAPAWRKVGSARSICNWPALPLAQWTRSGSHPAVGYYMRAPLRARCSRPPIMRLDPGCGRGRAASQPASHCRTSARSLRANRHFVFQSQCNLWFGQTALWLRDGGHAWRNLTALGSRSVIGDGVNSIAVSPADTDQLVAANDFGVWRSLDGGLSWSALNLGCPIFRCAASFDGHRNVGDDCRGGEPGHAGVAAERLAMATGGRKPVRCLAGGVVFEPAAD